MIPTLMTQLVLFNFVFAPTLSFPIHKAAPSVQVQGDQITAPLPVEKLQEPTEPIAPLMLDEGLSLQPGDTLIASPLLNKLINEAQSKNVQN